MGGKMDDITVLVARVTPSSEIAATEAGGRPGGQGGTNLTMPGSGGKAGAGSGPRSKL
jgi:hypothetical protein